MKANYSDRFHIITVYVIDPHPNGARSPYNKGNGWQEWWEEPYRASVDNQGDPLLQPRTFRERVAQARSMMKQLGITTPVLIDEMDNPVWCTYGYKPNCAYLIGTDGTVIEKQSWYNNRQAFKIPTLMETAMMNYLSQ